MKIEFEFSKETVNLVERFIQRLREDQPTSIYARVGGILFIISVLVFCNKLPDLLRVLDGPKAEDLWWIVGSLSSIWLLVSANFLMISVRNSMIFSEYFLAKCPFRAMVEVNDDGIQFEDADSNCFLKWSAIAWVCDEKEAIYLYHGTGLLNVIPNSAFATPEGRAEFFRRLAERIKIHEVK